MRKGRCIIENDEQQNDPREALETPTMSGHDHLYSRPIKTSFQSGMARIRRARGQYHHRSSIQATARAVDKAVRWKSCVAWEDSSTVQRQRLDAVDQVSSKEAIRAGPSEQGRGKRSKKSKCHSLIPPPPGTDEVPHQSVKVTEATARASRQSHANMSERHIRIRSA